MHFLSCQRNHDISREEARSRKYIDDGLRDLLVTVDSINAFIDGSISIPTKNEVALERLASFEAFQTEFGTTPVTATPFVKTYLPSVADAKIGIACFNTAWRATGEPNDADRG